MNWFCVLNLLLFMSLLNGLEFDRKYYKSDGILTLKCQARNTITAIINRKGAKEKKSYIPRAFRKGLDVQIHLMINGDCYETQGDYRTM